MTVKRKRCRAKPRKLTRADCDRIIRRIANGERAADIAREKKVSQTCISLIKRGWRPKS